jgi:methylthioribose-1-phosphate isomerase
MTPSVSPLFEPVLWEENGFSILDETLCPDRLEYVKVADVDAALRAVKEMRTRAFGQVLTFLYSAALLARRYHSGDPLPLREQMALMTDQFCAARPTFDFKGLSSFFEPWYSAADAGVDIGAWFARQARGFAAEIIKARYERARRTAAILPNPARILTHCNISGELVAIAQFCLKDNKPFSVIATETRPYLQGTRLTAWELAQAGVPVSVIPDCGIAQVMDRGAVNAVIVGSDRCAQNGDIINKVGTYAVALTARRYGIPFYALVQPVGSLGRGEDLIIEERPTDELLYFGGRSLLPEQLKNVRARYPAFDITPAALVTKLIGFDDVFTPETFRNKFLRDSSVGSPRLNNQDQEYALVHGMPAEDGYRLLAAACDGGEVKSILVPEMRPQLWGARVIALELARRNVPVTLISDNMMASLFAQKQINKLFLFHTEMTEAGPITDCGGLLAAQLASAHDVAIDLQPSCSPKEAMLDRDAGTFLGMKVIPESAAVYPLEREVIPWQLCNPCKSSIS